MARYYEGPVSDHFRRHPPSLIRRARSRGSVIDLIRWRLTGNPSELARAARPAPMRIGHRLRSNDKSWRISFVGHASLLLQTAGLNLLLDPVWSRGAYRR